MIEMSMLLTILSVASAVVCGFLTARRGARQDTKAEAAQLTTVIIKLENIGVGVSEIKAELSNLKADAKENRERIVRVEESAKQAHKRLDDMFEEIGKIKN